MRQINKIIIHCSDSDNPNHDYASVIDQWHRIRGWSGIGYHYFIRKDGKIEHGRPLEAQGAHCKGHNKDSIGICVSGKERFTDAQMDTLYNVVQELCRDFGLHERGDVYPHNYFNKNKTCPNFELPDFYVGSKREKLEYDYPRDYKLPTEGEDYEE